MLSNMRKYIEFSVEVVSDKNILELRIKSIRESLI